MRISKLLLFCSLCLLPFFASAQNTQADSYALIKRLIPQRAGAFVIQSIGPKSNHDCFEIESKNGKIILRGNNGVAVASALYAASTQNLVRSIFVFFVTLFALAGLYVLINLIIDLLYMVIDPRVRY